MTLQYSMTIQWSPVDQVYVVSLPEFGDFCHTHGKTYEEAARRGQEAIESLIDALQAWGQPLPKPKLFEMEPEAALDAETEAPAQRQRA